MQFDRMRALACCFVFAISLGLELRCRAEGVIDMGAMTDERARSHFKVGKTLYEAGRFAEAAVEWEQAYELSHKGAILYNLYVTYRDAGDLPKATDALRRYLATDDVDSDIRVNLEARLHALEETNSRAAAQPAAPVTATPPQPAAPTGLENAARPAPPPAAAPAAPGGGPRQAQISPWPFVLFAAGGALIAGSVATGIVANNKITDIEHNCGSGTCATGYPLASQRSDAHTFRTVTLVLASAGVVTAGAGAVLLLLPAASRSDAGARANERAPSVGFACLPSACLGSVSGRF